MSEQFENNEKNENITPQKTDKKTNPMLPIYIGAAAILISVIIIVGVVIYNAFLKPEPNAEYLFNENLLCVKNDGKWGYVNKKGEYVIEAKYDAAYNFTENGLALVGERSDKGTLYYGYINTKGNIVANTEYLEAKDFSECGLAAVMSSRGWGVIDENGEIVVECEYERINIYDSGIITAKIDEVYYLINKKGERLSEGYDILNWHVDADVGVVYRGARVGIINSKGKEILEPTLDFELISGFNGDGIGYYVEEGKSGIINAKGKKLTDADFNYIDYFNEYGYSVAMYNGKYCIINSSGKIIYKVEDDGFIRLIGDINYYNYNSIRTYGFLESSRDRKNLRFFDVYGKELFEISEDSGWMPVEYRFSDNGLLPIVNDDGFYGYINRKGEIAISLDYSVAHSFSDCGIARVYTLDDDQYKFINKKGKTVGEGHAYVSNCYNDGYAIAIDLIEGEVVYKVVDKKGKTVCELDCDDVMLPNGESIMKQSSVISYLMPYSESGKKEFLIDYVRKNLSEEKLEKYGYNSAEEYVENLFSRMTDSQISQMFIVILNGATYFR